MPPAPHRTFWQRPQTFWGWVACGLLSVSAGMFLINAILFLPAAEGRGTWWQELLLPFYGVFILLVGVAASLTGLSAIIRQHERSWVVWVTLLPLMFIVFLIGGEILFPH